MPYQAYIVPAVILLFCMPAFFVEDHMVRPILALSGIALLLGVGASAWVWLMPADFLSKHPALADSPLQPAIAALAGHVLTLFGIGLLLALGCRVIWRRYGPNAAR